MHDDAGNNCELIVGVLLRMLLSTISKILPGIEVTSGEDISHMVLE
jgi:hypothetical protein